MTAVHNVLFVMCDQLRRDYVSCYGGEVETPNIDALAARGVRFDNAFVRGSAVRPHELLHRALRQLTARPGTACRCRSASGRSATICAARASLALAGKTHVMRDEALARLHRDRVRTRALLERGGFDVIDRYDGHTPPGRESGYAGSCARTATTAPTRGPTS